MNKDTKVLLTALVVIVIGAISFNYMNITGKTISDYTTITISPKLITAGDSIYITINPGKQGVYQEIEFYRADKDMRIGQQIARLCKTTKCYEKNTVEFEILDIWDKNAKWGFNIDSKTYYARVYDIYSGKYIRSYFTVERAYPAAGPAEYL